LLIPSIRVTASIESVGLDRQGAIATPSRPSDVAWYAGSVAPGASGNAVVDGHLDWWSTGPAVFWNLKRLKPGDQIIVVDRSGRSLRFRVTGTLTLAENANTASLFRSDGPATLSLVTCAGAWDAAHHTYIDRLIVNAVLVN
jgi:LPXTG-site transpeptidase (sortase) family protein